MCVCGWVDPCVQAGSAAQVVFELTANRCAFACPYVSTRSYIHHLSMFDANLALLSQSAVSVFTLSPACLLPEISVAAVRAC